MVAASAAALTALPKARAETEVHGTRTISELEWAAHLVPRYDTAPPGIPTLKRWKQHKNGRISGYINGSRSYNDGEYVTTSPIEHEALTGTVVVTSSGTRYFLSTSREMM